MKPNKIAYFIAVILLFTTLQVSDASVENPAQNIVHSYEEYEKNNKTPKNVWVFKKSENEEKYIYYDDKGEVKREQSYDPNLPLKDILNDDNSGLVKINSKNRDGNELDINIVNLDTNAMYIIRVNEDSQEERLPTGKYKIQNIGAVDNEGYYKETQNKNDGKEFEIKSQKDDKDKLTLDIDINEIKEVDEIVNADLIDPELLDENTITELEENKEHTDDIQDSEIERNIEEKKAKEKQLEEEQLKKEEKQKQENNKKKNTIIVVAIAICIGLIFTILKIKRRKNEEGSY